MRPLFRRKLHSFINEHQIFLPLQERASFLAKIENLILEQTHATKTNFLILFYRRECENGVTLLAVMYFNHKMKYILCARNNLTSCEAFTEKVTDQLRQFSLLLE